MSKHFNEITRRVYKIIRLKQGNKVKEGTYKCGDKFILQFNRLSCY